MKLDRYSHLIFLDTFNNIEGEMCYYLLEADKKRGIRVGIITPVIHRGEFSGYILQAREQRKSRLSNALVELADFLEQNTASAQTSPSRPRSGSEENLVPDRTVRTTAEYWNP
jgi:hypothetical protein